MRGENTKQSSMLMLMSPESRVPATHPIRRIKALSDDALSKLSPMFDAMYSSTGRPSIPPERLLKATLLMALYSVRSERQFCEQLDYNLLFRWFLDMDMTEASFDATAFTHNRARLIAHDVAGEFFRAVVDQAKAANLMSSDQIHRGRDVDRGCSEPEELQAEGRRRYDAAGRPGESDRGLS